MCERSFPVASRRLLTDGGVTDDEAADGETTTDADADADLERVLERITDAFLSMDADWRVTYINEQGAAFFDRTPEEMVGEDFWMLFPEGADGPFYRAYERALAEQEPQTVEHRSLVYDDLWLEARAYPTETGLSVYFRDVTDRKEMEAALRERTRRIEALHEVGTELATCESQAEAFELAVAAAEDILAFDICYAATVEDGVIKPQAANVPELADRSVLMSVDEGAVGNAVRTGETYVVDDATDDPHAQPVEDEYVSAVAIPIEEVGVFQALATVPGAFSKTDRELAELLVANLGTTVRRLRSEAAIRASRDRFASLFENVPDAAVHYAVADDRLVVRAVNPAFTSVFGYEAEAVVGTDLSRFFPGTEVDPPERRWLATPETREPHAEHEVDRVTADGPRPFLVRTARIPGQETLAGYAIYTDISELKRRERELERQNERLDRFAGVVSHDLRNPLNVARGHLELLAEECGPHERIERIEAAHERMAELVDDVLTLAREGAAVTDPEAVDVGEVARLAWRNVATSEATLVTVESTLMADPGRLERLFENLFHNAVEHGAPDVTVRLERTADGFAVVDDGPGVETADPTRLFDSGYTTDQGGTGFGLAIVREVALAHGWEIELGESGPDEGARFVVSGVTLVD